MGLEERLSARLELALKQLVTLGELPREALGTGAPRYSVDPPRTGGSGDLATNAAMVLAKAAGKKPRDLAEALAAVLRTAPEVSAVEVAGPGFLNLTLQPSVYSELLHEIASAGANYGRQPAASASRVNVEFVSANPTGPLLISHGRGAVIGDCVARLLEVTGHRVTREYYINDFGNQVRLLAVSVRAAAKGEEAPEGGYGGFYVKELAEFVKKTQPALLEGNDEDGGLRRYCISLMLQGIPGSTLEGIQPMLDKLGLEFDVWTSEEGLHRWGRVELTLQGLEAQGRLKSGDDGAVYFVTGEEDDKDRVVRKSDGGYTYFASDICYHQDKFRRGFDHLVDVWGADHHGYIQRLRLAIEATGNDPNAFEVLLFQLVSLVRDGKPVRMGKRLGNLITLQEVMEEIDEAVGNPHAGRDALRFFYLSRRTDTPIVLDVELAKKQRNENPVYYIQYGYARLCSILRKAEERGVELPPVSAELLARVNHPLEQKLVALLGRFPAALKDAAAAREPQKLVTYLGQIAQEFQSYYTQLGSSDPILPRQSDLDAGVPWDRERTQARLLFVDAVRQVYGAGLGVLGLSAPERMVRQEDEESSED